MKPHPLASLNQIIRPCITLPERPRPAASCVSSCLKAIYESFRGWGKGADAGALAPASAAMLCRRERDALRLGALRTLGCLELHLRVLVERLVALADDRAVVNEQVLAASVGGDESVPLVGVEPLDGSCCHKKHLLCHSGTGRGSAVCATGTRSTSGHTVSGKSPYRRVSPSGCAESRERCREPPASPRSPRARTCCTRTATPSTRSRCSGGSCSSARASASASWRSSCSSAGCAGTEPRCRSVSASPARPGWWSDSGCRRRSRC